MRLQQYRSYGILFFLAITAGTGIKNMPALQCRHILVSNSKDKWLVMLLMWLNRCYKSNLMPWASGSLSV